MDFIGCIFERWRMGEKTVAISYTETPPMYLGAGATARGYHSLGCKVGLPCQESDNQGEMASH